MTKEATDYNAKLAQDYEEIRDKVERGMLPLVARIPAIDKAVSDYAVAQAELYESKRAKAEREGRSPNTVPIAFRDSNALDRYADLILYEELKWSHPDKMTIVDYPVMSDRQTKSYYEDHSHKGDLQFGDLRYLGKRKVIAENKDGSHDVKYNRILDGDNADMDAVIEHIDVHKAIEGAGLTPRQREAIDLVFFGNEGEGMTQEQAGEVMGVHRANVNEYIKHGLAKIKRNMTKTS